MAAHIYPIKMIWLLKNAIYFHYLFISNDGVLAGLWGDLRMLCAFCVGFYF